MAIDWSKAPEGAEFYANGHFRKAFDAGCPHKWDFVKWVRGSWTSQECRECLDYCERPKQWPETDERITAIAQNGNTGEHYQSDQPKTAVEFLNSCAAVQSERGKQFDASGTGERSFAAAASAFNAATGKSLTGSDVCLLLTMVKLVRQYSSPDRLHQDSLLDGVSYLSLWAEELTKELSK
jgi:hypothetical protein